MGECAVGYVLRESAEKKLGCIQCDDMLWEDESGRSCSDYVKQGLCGPGKALSALIDRPYQGLKPSDACCSCGGGDITATPFGYPANLEGMVIGQNISVSPVPLTANRY